MSPWARAGKKHSSPVLLYDIKDWLPACFAVLKLGSILSRRDKHKVREVKTVEKLGDCGETGRLCPTRDVPRADVEIMNNHECQPSHGSMLLFFCEDLLSPMQI